MDVAEKQQILLDRGGGSSLVQLAISSLMLKEQSLSSTTSSGMFDMLGGRVLAFSLSRESVIDM